MVFNLCETWEWRQQHTNPVRGIEKAKEEPRDRTFSPAELRDLGKAFDTLSDDTPAAVAALRVAGLTGLRISEVLRMTWDNVNLHAELVTLPTTKTGRRQQVLPDAAVEIIACMPRINDNAFTTGLGIGLHVLRDLLGHKTTAIADRYIRRTGSALVDATKQSGAAIAAMLDGVREAADVVPLRRNA